MYLSSNIDFFFFNVAASDPRGKCDNCYYLHQPVFVSASSSSSGCRRHLDDGSPFLCVTLLLCLYLKPSQVYHRTDSGGGGHARSFTNSSPICLKLREVTSMFAAAVAGYLMQIRPV